MKKQPSLLATLLRKDLRLFGPFAALIALLQALWQFPNLVVQLGAMAGLIQTGLQFGALLLILVVCQEDAIVSLKHDWLTRPISGLTQLLAKSIFVLLTVVLPAILGALLYHLTQGHSIGEAVLDGVSSGARGSILAIGITAMAFAAITSSIRQAVIVFLAGLAVVALVTMTWIALHREVWESAAFSGSGWVLQRGMMLLLAVSAMSVLWLQYRHRHTRASRGVAVAATLLGMWIVVVMGWSPAFALQKALSADPNAAAAAQVDLAQGCFPARVLGANSDSNPGGAGLTAQRYSEEHRKFAGLDAMAFSTRLNAQVPTGDLLVVNHVEVRYFNGDQQQHRLRPGRTSYLLMQPIDGRAAADHYWLLSAVDAKRLESQPAIQARLDYSLSLLAPQNMAQFMADGHRSYYDGIGYCGADFDRSSGTVAVSCFKPGAQPALLVASVDGADSAPPRRPVDFTPVWLDFWGGHRYEIQLGAHGNEMPRVKVTTYQARAHFDRQIIRPGVLGGPVSACPAP